MSNRTPRTLHAAADSTADRDADLVAMSGAVELQAAATGDAKKLRRFEMQAYNGGAMRFGWSDVPVVVDLAGMQIDQKPRPIYRDHRENQIVGHTTAIANDGKTLRISGIVSGAGQAAREVVESADQGFPWQASIGADVERPLEQVRAGATVTVNGQAFQGPVAIVRRSRLKETSFVPLGADDSTSARMSAGRNNLKTNTQTKESVVHKITLSSLLALAAAFPHVAESLQAKAEIVQNEDDDSKKGAADLKAWAESQEKPVAASADDGDETDLAADLKAARKVKADEARRCAAISKLCAGKHADIEAKAIEEGWTVDKAELTVLRAARPAGPNIGGGNRDHAVTSEILEVAALQAARAPEATLKRYSERTLDAADKRFRGRISLQELLLEAAWANGFTGRSFRQDVAGVLRAAFQLQADGFSTVDIGGILSNIANKSLLEGFMAVDQAWRQISAVAPVSDFKTVTRYRLTGDNKYEKVGNGGEIKHGKVADMSYTNKADTYAKMLALTRQDLINDDLGALATVPRVLGRGAALALNEVFWTEFMDNSSFFATGNSNYFSGSTTNLSIDSLTTAEQKFLDQTDPDGKPLAIMPKILLVPTALSALSAQLMRSLEIRDTTASTKYAVGNPHAGKFTPVVTPYLSNALIAGYSSTAWHLLADPRDLAAIETCFLNGQEVPIVESAAADFSTLGVEMRGYHDFGVKKQEYRAGVKSKGAA